jgi:hypothetical protein
MCCAQVRGGCHSIPASRQIVVLAAALRGYDEFADDNREA